MANRQLLLKAATTSQYVGRVVDRSLAPTGIPGYLLALVTHVRDHQPVSPTAVSVASGVPLTTLRDNIQRLVERGLVRRVENPADARSYLLELTPAGEAVTRAADPALGGAYDELERRLPRPLGDYEGMLDELNDALGAMLQPGERPAPAAA
jgi:DNA-binding MarR family transcriptional regulator